VKAFFAILLTFLFALTACTAQPNPESPTAEPSETALPPTPDNPLPGATGLDDPYYPGLGNGGYDTLHYLIDLDVDMEGNEIAGQTTIQAQATQDLSTINLDFLGLIIDQILINEEPATYKRDGLELTIFLPSPVSDDQIFDITIAYHGTPGEGIDTSELESYEIGWGYYGNGVYIAGEPNGSSSWYPVNEHPLDKATYSFRITVEEPYMVAANGTLQEVIAGDGESTFLWEASAPIASYLVTMGIAEFEIETEEGPDGVTIRNYFGKNVARFVRLDFQRTAEMIELFNELFGPYPFDNYGVLVHDLELRFALETQTLSVFGRSFTNETVVSHELAHQWFGDSVALSSWQDIWLNEGFATYASILWSEYAHGIAAAEEAMRDMYANMAPGAPTFNLRKSDLLSTLRDDLAADLQLEPEQAGVALTLLLSSSLSEDALENAISELPEAGLSKTEFISLVNELPFSRATLTAFKLADFFELAGNQVLAQSLSGGYPPPGDPGADSLFSRSVYQRGALTLHALRLELGDEAFFDTLRLYASRYKNSNASIADFIAISEEVSGQELDDLFNDWLYAQDIPDLPELDLFRSDFVEANE
jgi:aminopeptidase N